MLNFDWFFQGKHEMFYFFSYVLFLTFLFWYIGVGDFLVCFVGVLLITFSYLALEKRIAKKYGCSAVYKLNPIYILFSLVLAFFKIPMTLLGITEIHPYRYGRWGFKVISLGRLEIGYVGFSGIAVTLGLSILFKFLSIFSSFFIPFYKIAAIISFYNLLFIPDSEGFKIYSWSPGLWIFLLIIAGFMAADVAFVLGFATE